MNKSKQNSLKRKIFIWSAKIGHRTAIERLMGEGLSHAMSYRLVRGIYEHEPKELAKEAIRRALRYESKRG